MTATVIAEPLPVLAVTARATPERVDAVIVDSVAALREAARRLGVVPTGPPVRVAHGDESIVEVCLPVAELPADDPPAPIAAEVLVPGTQVARISPREIPAE